MYGVSTQGTNFHSVCSRVVVLTPAVNAPTEIQQWGRIIRINQQNECLIIRFKCLNSHDQYRDSKQSDKMFTELAMRAFNPQILGLLTDLLNEYQYEVNDAWDSQERKRETLVDLSAEALDIEDNDSSLSLAPAVSEEKIPPRLPGPFPRQDSTTDDEEAAVDQSSTRPVRGYDGGTDMEVNQGQDPPSVSTNILPETTKRKRTVPDRTFNRQILNDPVYTNVGYELEDVDVREPSAKKARTRRGMSYRYEDDEDYMGINDEGDAKEYKDSLLDEDEDFKDEVLEYDPDDDDDYDDEGDDYDDNNREGFELYSL
ncbi:MAG: hypothetical protein Q9160_003943 [Pyrenula sp. 1 TL-2023]